MTEKVGEQFQRETRHTLERMLDNFAQVGREVDLIAQHRSWVGQRDRSVRGQTETSRCPAKCGRNYE